MKLTTAIRPTANAAMKTATAIIASVFDHRPGFSSLMRRKPLMESAVDGPDRKAGFLIQVQSSGIARLRGHRDLVHTFTGEPSKCLADHGVPDSESTRLRRDADEADASYAFGPV